MSTNTDKWGNPHSTVASPSRSDHDHPLDPISKILPNPLSDTTTAISEGHRPTIYDSPNQAGLDSSEPVQRHNEEDLPSRSTTRIDDSWNSNTLTLNMNHDTTITTAGTSFKKLNTHTLTKAQAEARQRGLDHDWEATWEKERLAKRQEKVREDLKGWRGGNGLV
jgi:hypothetical protein